MVQESSLQGSLTFANSMAGKHLVYCVCLPQLLASRVWCLRSESPIGTLGRDRKVSMTRKWKDSLCVWGRSTCFHHFALLHSCSLSVWSQSFCSSFVLFLTYPWAPCHPLHSGTPLKGPSLNRCHLEQPPLISELCCLAPFSNLFGKLALLFWPLHCDLFLSLLSHW